MDVLISETCWAVNNEIMKQVTWSWSLFIQLLMKKLQFQTVSTTFSSYVVFHLHCMNWNGFSIKWGRKICRVEVYRRTSLGLFEVVYLDVFWEMADIPAGTRKSGFRMEVRRLDSCGVSDVTRLLSTGGCAFESVRIGLRISVPAASNIEQQWICLCIIYEPTLYWRELRLMPRKSNNNGFNDTILKTFILFIQFIVNWFANLSPTNAQLSILCFIINWLLHVLEQHHCCNLLEDASCVESCRSNLIVKYSTWNCAFLGAEFVSCWRLSLLSYETMSTIKYTPKFWCIFLSLSLGCLYSKTQSPLKFLRQTSSKNIIVE